YALHNSMGDVAVAMIFGIIGFLMIRYDYPRITAVIALVLGELAERSYHQSMMIGDNSFSIFYGRPISAVLLVATVLIILSPSIRAWLRNRKREA
ncbi:MAG: hypothetical protein VW169_12045, partial [Rhodospirillaceae bacterium]